MDTINQNTNSLHDQAMHLANLAVKTIENNPSQTKIYFQEAFLLEQKAAMTLVNDFDTEPSRSVLFRSAAHLALKAELYREAERMAAFGLSGNPPTEIAIELREVFSKSVQHLKKVA